MVNSAFLYLHGFASSPESSKAQYLRQRFKERYIDLNTLDSNQGDFPALTLTRILRQVNVALVSHPPSTILGSSLGGLAAAWAGEQFPSVSRLVLLAPAFGFLPAWLARLGSEQVKEWQTEGSMWVYHYGEKRSQKINYTFVEDGATYDENQLRRAIPTLILHGTQDEIIPIENSRAYAINRPWVKLVELESDHSLVDVLPIIWREIEAFCLDDL